MDNNISKLKAAIRDVPDFPIPGILFKDITTLLNKGNLFAETIDLLFEYYKNKGITKVVGIESRGFIVGGTLAYKLGAGFVPIRKPGKLPAKTIKRDYTLEYGTNTIEIHEDALEKNDIVLLHDDLLATGGTSKAAVDLIQQFDVRNIFINFIIELEFLKGKETLGNNHDLFTLIKY